MLGRRIKILLRNREAAILGALALLTAFMLLGLALRLSSLWRFYLSPSYRRDATSVLSRLRDDTGWGLSNFEIKGTSCNASQCGMTIDFAYHAPAAIHPPSAAFRLSWTKGKPDTYAIQVN